MISRSDALDAAIESGLCSGLVLEAMGILGTSPYGNHKARDGEIEKSHK